MCADLTQFNTEGVDPQKSFEPLPPGWYQLWVTESELKDTKAGNGKFLSLKHEVCDGEFKGRVIFGNINLVNPNEKAVEIGYRQLAGLKLACGKPHAASSEELHHIPMWAKVKISKPREGFEPSNEIVEYKSASEAQPALQAAPAPQAPASSKPSSAPGQKSTPPWLKK